MTFATALGNFAPNSAANAFAALRAFFLFSAFQISASAFFAAGCADFGRAPRNVRDLKDL